MEKLTALFLDVLGKETGQEDRTTALAKESMQAEFSRRTGELLSERTVVLSLDGEAVLRKAEQLRGYIAGITEPGQAGEICGQFSGILTQTEKLHRETQTQIHKAGHIDAARLHFFYPGEQSEALDILDHYIKAELYRILVLLGGETFLSIEPLAACRHTLEGRVRYLKDKIRPITEQKKMKDLTMPVYWAVVCSTELRAGPLGVLPGFSQVEPVRTDHRFLPGEYREISARGNKILQGRGFFTNVKPDTVEMVQQKEKLHTIVSPEQLAECGYSLNRPNEVLEKLFSGSFYVIDPADYFSAASYVAASAALIERKRLGRCLLCGRIAVIGSDFCEQCTGRIRIV